MGYYHRAHRSLAASLFSMVLPFVVLRALVARVAVCFLTLAVLSSSLRAEIRNIHGIPLPVDRIETTDGNSVFLTLFGQTTIVAREKIDDVVLRGYFEREDLFERITIRQMESCVRDALEQGKVERAEIVFEKLLDGLIAQGADLSELLTFLEGQERSQDLFKRYLVKNKDRGDRLQLLYHLHSSVGISDPEWVRRNLFSMHRRDSKLFSDIISGKFVEALKDSRSEQVTKILLFVRTILGPTHPIVKKFAYAYEQSKTLADAAKTGELEKILPLLRVSNTDPLLRTALRPYVMKQIHDSAEQALKRGDAPFAIQTLIEITDEEERTPRTYQLALEALQALNRNQRKLLLDLEISHFFSQLSLRDKGMKQYFIRLLEDQTIYVAQNEALQTAEEYFSLLLEQRLDPNPANDRPRYALALAALDNKKLIRAETLIEEMLISPTLSQRARLLISGYYVNVSALLLIILVPILIFLLALFRIRSIMKNAEQADHAWRREYGERDESQFLSQTKSILDSGHTLHPLKHEYQQLLSILGVQLDADEKTIKASYRSLIKKVHPDLHDGNDADNEEFIELTNAYERILELRKILKLE